MTAAQLADNNKQVERTSQRASQQTSQRAALAGESLPGGVSPVVDLSLRADMRASIARSCGTGVQHWTCGAHV